MDRASRERALRGHHARRSGPRTRASPCADRGRARSAGRRPRRTARPRRSCRGRRRAGGGAPDVPRADLPRAEVDRPPSPRPPTATALLPPAESEGVADATRRAGAPPSDRARIPCRCCRGSAPCPGRSKRTVRARRVEDRRRPCRRAPARPRWLSGDGQPALAPQEPPAAAQGRARDVEGARRARVQVAAPVEQGEEVVVDRRPDPRRRCGSRG